MPRRDTRPLPDFFAFRASAQTGEALRDLAGREGRALSDVIRDSVNKTIAERSPIASPDRARLCAP